MCLHFIKQECMMMSFLLRREEKERVTGKFQNRQNLSNVLKLEHTFTQVRCSTIYDLTTQCCPHSQQDLNAPSLPGKFSALPDSKNFVLRCYLPLTGEECSVAVYSNSCTAVDMAFLKSFPGLCTPHVQVVHQP